MFSKLGTKQHRSHCLILCISNAVCSSRENCHPKSMPHHEDWVGIYPDTADPHDLGSPVAWFWLCGDKKHKCRTSVGAAVFPWLPPGTYKAVMSRNRDAKGPYANYGPYSSYAESRPFEVGRGNTCASRRRRVEGTEASSLRGAQP